MRGSRLNNLTPFFSGLIERRCFRIYCYGATPPIWRFFDQNFKLKAILSLQVMTTDVGGERGLHMITIEEGPLIKTSNRRL
jgi:hypothetical protein